MKEYPVDVMVVFVFGISGLFVAGVAGLVMAQDLDAWKLQPNLLLVTILYMVRYLRSTVKFTLHSEIHHGFLGNFLEKNIFFVV